MSLRNKISIQVVLILGLSFLFLGAKKPKLFQPPPGTLRLHDSLYVDVMPVKTKDYRAFLGALKNYYCQAFHDSVQNMPLWGVSQSHLDSMKWHFDGDSILFTKMLPRTLMTYDNYRQKYEVDYHLTNPRYLEYPVVNINRKHVKMFCQWRTDMIKLYYAVTCQSEKQRNKYPLNFKFRMITREEWELILGDHFADVGFITKEDRKESENMNVPKPYIKSKRRKFYYDVDNAAELLDNDVVSIDFTWTKSVGMGDISYIQFNKPSSFISFRCICEIIPLPEDKRKKKAEKKD
jgi:hypothetical protein